MNRSPFFCVLLLMASMLTGCQEHHQSPTNALFEDAPPSVAFISGRELTRRLSVEMDPIFVEFCVPMGCQRCDAMRPQIDRLASEYAEDAGFCRVNLNADREFAAACGVVTCPSYLLFENGQKHILGAWPTSGERLAGTLYSLTQSTQPTLPNQATHSN